MTKNISSPLVHFFGLHMFYYVIGISLYIWFLLGFDTEYDGRPLSLTLRYAWPIATLAYLPVAYHLYIRSSSTGARSKRLAKYLGGLLFFSFLTGFSSAGYTGVLYLVGGPQQAVVARAVPDRSGPEALVTFKTDSGKLFRVKANHNTRTMTVREGLLGYFYWDDNKL